MPPPTFDRIKKFELPDGRGTLHVQRLADSTVARLLNYVGTYIQNDDAALQQELAVILIKAGVCGADGLTDRDGKPVKFEWTHNPIARLASDDVVDAISGEDLVESILAIISPSMMERAEEHSQVNTSGDGSTSEDAADAGKSESSPAGSTSNDETQATPRADEAPGSPQDDSPHAQSATET